MPIRVIGMIGVAPPKGDATVHVIRGFDPYIDAVEFGRELIPRLKAGALALDRQLAA